MGDKVFNPNTGRWEEVDPGGRFLRVLEPFEIPNDPAVGRTQVPKSPGKFGQAPVITGAEPVAPPGHRQSAAPGLSWLKEKLSAAISGAGSLQGSGPGQSPATPAPPPPAAPPPPFVPMGPPAPEPSESKNYDIYSNPKAGGGMDPSVGASGTGAQTPLEWGPQLSGDGEIPPPEPPPPGPSGKSQLDELRAKTRFLRGLAENPAAQRFQSGAEIRLGLPPDEPRIAENLRQQEADIADRISPEAIAALEEQLGIKLPEGMTYSGLKTMTPLMGEGLRTQAAADAAAAQAEISRDRMAQSDQQHQDRMSMEERKLQANSGNRELLEQNRKFQRERAVSSQIYQITSTGAANSLRQSVRDADMAIRMIQNGEDMGQILGLVKTIRASGDNRISDEDQERYLTRMAVLDQIESKVHRLMKGSMDEGHKRALINAVMEMRQVNSAALDQHLSANQKNLEMGYMMEPGTLSPRFTEFRDAGGVAPKGWVEDSAPSGKPDLTTGMIGGKAYPMSREALEILRKKGIAQ